jgi:glycine dehydrogenase subunit 2
MFEMQRALGELAGLPHVALDPAAGAQGELAGLLLTKAYHADRGDHRPVVLAPEAAHGTNAATATMAGYQVVTLRSDERGGVDVADLRARLGPHVASLMLTNPNTLGLFDENILEITQLVRSAGGVLYYDGANFNPIMAVCRPGDMGFDIVHFNLHKSFGQPHGGGGPGAGPIAVSDRIEPYLPIPRVVRTTGEDGLEFGLDEDRPKSIGRLRGFHGPFGIVLRAYAYLLSLGADGLRDAAETAVLNANYLMARLREHGVDEYLPVAFERSCMHEFALSGEPMHRLLGVRTSDLAKRLLDYGFHPPTVYFPLIVREALLVEPTETESRETLDRFAAALADILREARDDPDLVTSAPHSTPVRRLDERRATMSAKVGHFAPAFEPYRRR